MTDAIKPITRFIFMKYCLPGASFGPKNACLCSIAMLSDFVRYLDCLASSVVICKCAMDSELPRNFARCKSLMHVRLIQLNCENRSTWDNLSCFKAIPWCQGDRLEMILGSDMIMDNVSKIQYSCPGAWKSEGFSEAPLRTQTVCQLSCRYGCSIAI